MIRPLIHHNFKKENLCHHFHVLRLILQDSFSNIKPVAVLFLMTPLKLTR